MRTERFRYDLPEELIAQHPIEPRDAARLLVGSDLTDRLVADLPELLQPGDLVVVNDTRVRAARLRGRRDPTGGAVELLLLEERGERVWRGLVKPARRLRAGDRLEFGQLSARLLTDPVDGLVDVRLESEIGGDIEDVIAEVGSIPLPPYIRAELEDPERYQTTYAARVGSAAAPTAGLHLTSGVLAGLAGRGIGVARVELRVGLDTFRPITTERIEDHEMHSEWISLPAETAAAIERTRRSGGRIVAIGTTVVRTLEARADGGGGVIPGEGTTDLFITPGYGFGVVDVLMTNFHIPGSSLLVLVAAFVGERWRDIYEAAVARRYRFLSFGDAMLVERAR